MNLSLVFSDMYFPSAKSPVGGSNPSKPDENITGKFDPTALERGAKALKELDSSPNATKAFEVIRLQEMTKQKEVQAQIENTQTQRQQLGLQRVQAESEEKRRLMSEQQEQERRTAQYKTQLEAELYQKKLEEQQRQNEDWLKKQHEQFLQHEQLRRRTEMEIEEARRRTLADQAKHTRDSEVTRASAEADGRIKQERENVDVHLRELRAKMAEERKTKLETVSATLSSLGSGFNALLADKARMTSLGLGLTGVALGVYAARQTARVVGNAVERSLGKPPLIRETSRRVWLTSPWAFARKRISSVLPSFLGGTPNKAPSFLDKIVLEESLSERLQWTTNALVNAKKNQAPFRHVLLYGPPGTGKTLFARTLARNSGLDYAVMTGGDVGPLGKDAVAEINKLFSWAGKSSKGLVLFIDEADAFLRQGRNAVGGGMSEETRNALSAFLHHTGTENNQVMCILATNAKEVLDRAVLDRIDESFEFALPAHAQRIDMLKLFINEFLAGKVELAPEITSDRFLEDVAARTAGLSGRQLSKLVLAWQAAVFGSQAGLLSEALASSVLEWRLAHHTEGVEEGEGPGIEGCSVVRSA